ncbi:unnamed protein product [Rotaria socialis]|uniref:Uncharacterized protein n=1 Tax=Rotaria socialis TaxID=392032 RepID=A0A818INT1_9BILA|nr:unnamed protein product [Rotaria socialis]CAF4446491.1 unnamed protein product [Rotaria socialis]CAF4515873.1 unnamed protein product [Rotaria socialis]CAF4581078.1 unnamed protein product [Rotaria socialis]CAF4813337.1 unnamed protein product [Rotaria socialis]
MDAFLSLPTSHCHARQPDSVPAIHLKNEIKLRTATTEESTSAIIHSVLRIYPLSAVVDADGRLPAKLRKTYRDEGFILHEDKKLNIFTKKTNLSILKQNKHSFANDTFKVCPDDDLGGNCRKGKISKA